jgi:hypothetical protein
MSRSPLPPNDGSEPGFSYCRDLSSAVVPSQNTHVIAPFRTVGFDEHSALKASFWRSTVEEASQAGDLDYVSIAMNLGGGRVWRVRESTPTRAGEIAMHPFEGAPWRFGLHRIDHPYQVGRPGRPRGGQASATAHPLVSARG